MKFNRYNPIKPIIIEKKTASDNFRFFNGNGRFAVLVIILS